MHESDVLIAACHWLSNVIYKRWCIPLTCGIFMCSDNLMLCVLVYRLHHVHINSRLACELSFQDSGRVPMMEVLERSMLRN